MSVRGVDNLMTTAVESLINAHNNESNSQLRDKLYTLDQLIKHFDQDRDFKYDSDKLEAIGYLKTIPLTELLKQREYQFLASQSFKKRGWVAIHSSRENIYYQKRRTEVYLTARYGDALWQRLNDHAPEKLPYLSVIHECLTLMPDNANHHHDWAAFLVSNLLNDNLTAADLGFTSDAVFDNEHAVLIRQILNTNDIQPGKPRGAQLKLPDDKAIQRAIPIEEHATRVYARFFAHPTLTDRELQTLQAEDAEKLTKKVEKRRRRIEKWKALREQINEAFCKRFGFKVVNRYEHQPSYEDEPTDYYSVLELQRQATSNPDNQCLLVVDISPELNLVCLKPCLNSKQIAQWQKRDLKLTEREIHFRSNLILRLTDDDFNASDYANSFGGWDCKPNKSAAKSIADMIAFFEKYAHDFYNFYQPGLLQLLDRYPIESIINKADRMELRVNYGFFLNDIELAFAYACRHWLTEKPPTSLFNLIADKLRRVHPQYPLKAQWQEGLKALETGPFFPELSENMSYRELEDHEISD